MTDIDPALFGCTTCALPGRLILKAANKLVTRYVSVTSRIIEWNAVKGRMLAIRSHALVSGDDIYILALVQYVTLCAQYS